MNNMRTAMVDPQSSTTWADVGKVLAYAITPFLLIWKAIVMYFKEREQERSDFIKAVVKEAMELSMKGIENQIKEMGERHDNTNTEVNKRIDDLFKELRKR